MTDRRAGEKAEQTAPPSGSSQTVAACGPRPQEVEIKFRADAATLQGLPRMPLFGGAAISRARELNSVYFDTAEEDLRANNFLLRVRRRGRATPVMAVKWSEPAAAGLFIRGEVEVPCRGGVPDLQLFDPQTREKLSAVILDRPLKAVFETRVKRRVALVHHRHSEIEVAFDEGVIVAGEMRWPLFEVELESKAGNLSDLLDCAFALSAETLLRLDFEAKSDKGYRLSRGEPPRVSKASSLALPQSASFDDVIGAVVSNALAHFAGNWAALRESDAPEAIHQLRVALRRMRASLAIFKRVIALPEIQDIRQEAKRIASALGPARECDAFRLNALQGPFGNAAVQLPGARQLLEAVEARRVEAYADARRLMEDAATTAFVLKVQGFIARRAWRTALPPKDLALLTSDGKDFATDVLGRLYRRALKQGKHLPDMPDEERHELRIALKNLRYAAEFFGCLFGQAKNTRSFLKLVADLQEDLGAHNDAATAQGFMESLRLPADAPAQFASGFLLGWYRHATIAADAHLAAKWKDFRRRSVFWDTR